MAAMVTDAVIVILLVFGIAYAFVLNARVKRLMNLLRELEPAVSQFSVAVDKSEASVMQMQRNILMSQDDTDVKRSSDDSDRGPLFSTQRNVSEIRNVGMQVVRNKQDLVRRFFDLSRSEGRT